MIFRFFILIICALAGCTSVEYYSIPEGRPTSSLTVSMPDNSYAGSYYVLVSAYKQPESCIDSKLMKSETATSIQPAVNLLEAGRLQTIRLTLIRRTISGHQVQCSSMVSFLPQAGLGYEIKPVSQSMSCTPRLWRQGANGVPVPAEHKVRTPTASSFFPNKNGECSDAMALK